MDTKVLHEMGRSVLGLLLCAAAALIAALLSVNRPWHGVVPIAFVVAIVLLAGRYGLMVGILGSVIAALVFAYFLFHPLASFRVSDPLERSRLAWMLLGGVVISFLLLPPARNANSGPRNGVKHLQQSQEEHLGK